MDKVQKKLCYTCSEEINYQVPSKEVKNLKNHERGDKGRASMKYANGKRQAERLPKGTMNINVRTHKTCTCF